MDLVFPVAEPLSGEKRAAQEQRDKDELERGKEQVAALPGDVTLLEGYWGNCKKLLEDESDRRQGVEGRLTTMMGLCSIAATVVFGAIVGAATGTFHTQSMFLRFGLALGALYLTLQLCSAILAAVRGLSRRSYSVENSDVVLPGKDEDQAKHLRRYMGWCLESLSCHRANNNAKVTQMAVAHRAITNFLVGLIVVALLGTVYAIREQRRNDAVETLRQSPELLNGLHGPQGPVGPAGPVGPKGDSGCRCKGPGLSVRRPPAPCAK